MPHAQLTWQQGAVLGALLLAAALVLRVAGDNANDGGNLRARTLTPFAREAGVVSLLYSLWQLAGSLSNHSTAGAFSRARWILRIEGDWHLPAELDLQQPLLHHAHLAQAANIYYATMHFGMLFALLLWLFWRHRGDYPSVRTTLIAFTSLSLLVQLIPVAPPRLLPDAGFTDVAAHYGQSVYDIGGLSADQLSAMPSVHVGWALIVAGAVIQYGRGRWRWLVLAHPVITIYIVVATANHWWLDGVAAAVLLAAVVGAQLTVGLRHRPPGGRVRRVPHQVGTV